MRDLLTMQERLESLFGRAAPGWVPPVDLIRTADAYVLTVELPGLRREDIQIDADRRASPCAGSGRRKAAVRSATSSSNGARDSSPGPSGLPSPSIQTACMPISLTASSR